MHQAANFLRLAQRLEAGSGELASGKKKQDKKTNTNGFSANMNVIKTFLNLGRHLMQIELALGLVEAGGQQTCPDQPRGSCDSSDHVEGEFEIKGAHQASVRTGSVSVCVCV